MTFHDEKKQELIKIEEELIKIEDEFIEVLQQESQKSAEIYQSKIEKLEKLLNKQQKQQKELIEQNSQIVQYLDREHQNNSGVPYREILESSRKNQQKLKNKQQKLKKFYWLSGLIQAAIACGLVVFIALSPSYKNSSSSFKIITSFTAGFLGVASLEYFRRSLKEMNFR